jgi:hypothetical protein
MQYCVFERRTPGRLWARSPQLRVTNSWLLFLNSRGHPGANVRAVAHMDTDGAASHFKSRYTMRYWCEMKAKLDGYARERAARQRAGGKEEANDVFQAVFEVLCMWETCAPGHGKGPWDGLGAAIESWIRRQELHAEKKGDGKTARANSALAIFKMLCEFARSWQKGVRSRCKIDAW